MEFIKVKDGIVVEHVAAKECPDKETYRPVKNFTGVVGIPVNQLSEEGEVLSVAEILEKGILSPGENETIVFSESQYVVKPDYRGLDYWDKKTGEKVVFAIGDTPDEAMTSEKREDADSVWNGEGWEVPPEIVEARARGKRFLKLVETDFIMMPDYPCNNKSDFQLYRQALRDVTEQEGFPEIIEWPEKPEIK